MRGISLCAGIGGIDLGLALAMGKQYRTVCYVEGEIYCASVLAARMQDGALCDAPIWSNVKTFDPRPWRGRVDIITAGYPCQPFSNAGRRKGSDDPRHLWPYIARIIAVIRPRYVLCENVPGHISLGLEHVRADLQKLGYDVQAGIFSASECGAPHIRKRVFILAHAAHAHRMRLRQQHRRRRRPQGQSATLPGIVGAKESLADADCPRQLQPPRVDGQIRQRTAHCSKSGSGEFMADAYNDGGWPDGAGKCQVGRSNSGPSAGWSQDTSGPASSRQDVANPNCTRCEPRSSRPSRALWDQAWGKKSQRRDGGGKQPIYWRAEPRLDRLADGLPCRVDQVRSLGNAVVPAVACRAWLTLCQSIQVLSPRSTRSRPPSRLSFVK